jgi:PAS domain S-box-containing protein
MDKPITVTESDGSTELKGSGSVEQDLVDARQQLETIFDTMQAGIILVNPQGVITFGNKRMADMFGCTLEDLIGSGYSEHVHPDQRNTGDERMRSLIAGKIDHVHHERHYVRRDGSDFWGHLSGRRQEDGQGNLVSLVGVIADITEVKNAQQAIQESEERYRTIIETMQDVYYRADTEGKLIMVSPSGAEMLGYDSVDQILGCSIRDTFYYDPEERDAFLHNLRLKGKMSGYELTLKTRDGSPVPVSVSSHLLFAADGSFMGVEGVYHDISQFRQAMDRLKASEDKFARAFNYAPVLMSISTIEDGRYLEVNDRFCEISGYSRQEVLGRTSIELGWFSSAERERVIAVFKLEGRIHDMEISLTAKDGRAVYCLYSAEQITLEGESRLLSIAIDITERKRDLEALDYSNECFTQALHGSQHILYRLNVKKGGYDYLSPIFEKITGYSVADFMNTSLEQLQEYFHPDDRQRVFGEIAEKSRDQAGQAVSFSLEYRLRKADGNYCWLHDSTTACINMMGEPECFFGSALDITERKRVENALQESELKFRTLFATLQDAIYLTRADDGQIVECSDKMSGYARDELIGRSTMELNLWAEASQRQQVVDLVRENGFVNDFEATFRRKDGSIFPGSISTNVLTLHNGTFLLSVIRDMTERKRAEESLREFRELFMLFMKYTPVYTFIKQIEGGQSRVIQISDNYVDMVGKPAEELRGRTMYELFPAEFARKITDDDVAVVNGGKVIQLDEDLNGRNYTTVKFPIFREGKNTLLAGFTLDITERKCAEVAIKASEERFRSIMALSPDIISIISENGNLIYNSPAAFSVHGYTQEEMTGRNTLDLIHPDDQGGVGSAFNDVLNNPMKVITTQYRYRNKDGSYAWMECSACNQLDNPLINGIIAISRNIDDRKKLEEDRLDLERQLQHTQKLESLGVLAGGIAHDFNNILMTIVGNADLALMRLSKESPVVDNLHCIEQAAARAADLARQMLAYSGKGKFVVESIDLNRLLEEMLNMLEVSISKKAVLRLNLTRPLPLVEADATQMRQIIMNLVINASEAIGDKSGVIAISTGCMDCDRNYLKDVWLDENLSGGLYVYLEIVDSGCGMSRETLERIFDPFYTTKFTGRGLGMAAVLGIVRGHRGAIKVSSEPEAGTTFKVLLPASGKPAELFDEVPHDEEGKRTGTVLLVDDEETVRGIGAEMLKELGFTVITADDGRKAIDVFQQNPDVCFVLLDLTMPHMDGEQCFRELRRIKPDVRVIMSSGYNEQEVTQKFAGKGLNGFIQKPYRLSTLQEAIGKIQDA